MKDTLKFVASVAAVAVVAGIVAGLVAIWALAPKALPTGNPNNIGSVGGLQAENYISYVRYNGGYSSADDIKTSADLNTSGTLTVTGSSAFSAASVFTGAFTLGTNGTSLAAIKTGTCTIWAPGNTIVATSSQLVECQSATNGSLSPGLTGVTTDSICSLNFASSTAQTFGDIGVMGVTASSTANGSILARLFNLSGTTFT